MVEEDLGWGQSTPPNLSTILDLYLGNIRRSGRVCVPEDAS